MWISSRVDSREESACAVSMKVVVDIASPCCVVGTLILRLAFVRKNYQERDPSRL